MSLCMIAVRLPDKDQLYMLEQLADKSFGNKYILDKWRKFWEETNVKLSDLAILSDSYLAFSGMQHLPNVEKMNIWTQMEIVLLAQRYL